MSLFTADRVASWEAVKSDINIQVSLFTAADLLARKAKNNQRNQKSKRNYNEKDKNVQSPLFAFLFCSGLVKNKDNWTLFLLFSLQKKPKSSINK